MTEQTIEEGKKLAIVAYITIFGPIIAYFLNNDKKNDFSSFHIRQGLGLWIMFLLLGRVISSFDSWVISSSFYLSFTVLFIYGISSAISGKTQQVPLVGALFQKIFSNIGNKN